MVFMRAERTALLVVTLRSISSPTGQILNKLLIDRHTTAHVVTWGVGLGNRIKESVAFWVIRELFYLTQICRSIGMNKNVVPQPLLISFFSLMPIRHACSFLITSFSVGRG